MRFGLAGLLWICFSVSAAQGQTKFGDKGTLVPFGTIGFTFTSTAPAVGNASTQTLIDLSPSLGYFIADSIAIGGLFSLRYLSSGSASATLFSLAPSIAANAWLGDKVSIAPQFILQFGFGSGSDANSSGSLTLFTMAVRAPVLFHPAQHFFIGFGPSLSYDFLSTISSGTASATGPKTTAFGLVSSIGGWF